MIFQGNGTASDVPSRIADERDTSPLASLAPLLDALAQTIAIDLGWGTVVVSIYRAACDDFQVATVHGTDSARRALLGSTAEWRPLLEERFHRRGAYLVRHDELDWEPDAWHSRDMLIVPLAHSDGYLLGVVSVDEPVSGRRPTDEELDLLTAAATQVARAIEPEQREAEPDAVVPSWDPAAERRRQDITERRETDRERERRHRELAALHRTTYDLIETLDEDGVLTTIVASACDLLRTENGYVYLLDPETNLLVSCYGTGEFEQCAGATLGKGEGIGGRVWETGETLAVESYEDWDGRSEQFTNLGFRAVAGVPLRSRSGFLGVLGIGYQDGTIFTRDDLDLLEQFGRLASLALENARLYTHAQREIDERRQAEAELRQSKELQTRVLETSTDSITLFELDGTIAFASRSHQDMLGWSPEELAGRNFIEFVHPEDLAQANLVIARALQTGESGTYSARIRHKDGHWVMLEGKPVAIRDEQGNPELILALARDVTERQNNEDRRRELETQLRQSQKMDAIGRLAGGIAHDFNNLLTAIAGYGGLALDAVDDGQDELRGDIQEILNASERARQLIRQLLAFGRKQVLQPSVLDLNEVVGDMESILRRLIGEDIELVTRLDPNLGHTNADEGQIEQVVMNFAVNARDAMTGGGKLVIETLNAEVDAEFAATHLEAPLGPVVALRVTDTGHGMSDSVRSRIFEPFFTTKEEAKGTGLGLATVYGIVKQSGGYVWCESTPEAGTAFNVYLPRSERLEAELVETIKPLESPTGVETVLVAEDEEFVRRLVAELLGRLGYAVIAAANGAEALERLDDHPGDVDLLLTDVVMPGMNGRDLAAVVRERCPATRVLFMSGYAEDAVASDGVLQPGAMLLEKPFTAASLGTTVRAVLDGVPVA